MNAIDGLDALAAVQLTEQSQTLKTVGGRAVETATATVPSTIWPTTAALSGFHFNLVGNVDHHSDDIRAVLEPDAGQTSVHVTYKDDGGNVQPFDWTVTGLALPTDPPIFTVSGTSPGGVGFSGPLPGGPGVHVLVGFDVSYVGDDHELDELGVQFVTSGSDTVVQVNYNDQNDDDDFAWEVRYAVIPSASVVCGSTPLLGPVSDFDSYSTGMTGLPLLRGFYANFEDVCTSGEDHHIDEVGFDVLPDGMTWAWYNDKNDDDCFFWRVDWAFLTP